MVYYFFKDKKGELVDIALIKEKTKEFCIGKEAKFPEPIVLFEILTTYLCCKDYNNFDDICAGQEQVYVDYINYIKEKCNIESFVVLRK